jgi:hypothetical protein
MTTIRTTVTFDLVLSGDEKGIPQIVEWIGWAGVIDAGLHEMTKEAIGFVEIKPGTRKMVVVSAEKKPKPRRRRVEKRGRDSVSHEDWCTPERGPDCLGQCKVR